MLQDLRRHLRFLLSFALGLAAGLALYRMQLVDRLLIFSVLFCAGYLVLTGLLMRGISAQILRGQADRDDEGMILIVPLAVGAVAISLAAILLTIRDPHAGIALRPVLALASVPLGWVMIHTVMAFHYASLWYARGPDGTEARGLGFPGLADGEDAGIWDFLYYSFTLGMAAQTADVTALTTRMRRVTLFHSAFAFFYNTVLLALAVNAAVSLG
ncbi:DUF1345 domain-containing protein [Paracoccus denitrificans]|jgi:uncharacterized membrane protein|uniref:DUF1345 domain-containing protein n=1 Tax=Paracoccus denitrificans (strain Pd 1222) TaxID=318586 RepID=A1B881_PARDP|nr:DUF1345 domain-containing protein [Paracoccus denitrificans]ABL71725.1 protein of unknown function DUF1345 [Paracoccus denitrificans PD1222]MBB4628181.1 putative membrane protein [Paracoccus denitrificans]MCU7429246.1 DUF1345 domain-containing protein [Paracoccus denitrificans]QAR28316.1 DUF1345 domain-containing protein [Paracoccus denitrificans]UPV98057.1 DUF1345 domain-containing protein [Paracoccus denitrificans]